MFIGVLKNEAHLNEVKVREWKLLLFIVLSTLSVLLFLYFGLMMALY